MLYVLIGKSSTGKDTIYQRLMEDESLHLKSITTYTTRPIREGEREGLEYHFVDTEQMERLEEMGKVVERRTYHTVYGEWNYFTVDDGTYDLVSENYIVIGTLESFEKIRSYYGKDKVVPLYIEVEDGERLERALLREKSQEVPKYAEMCRRYLADEMDFTEEKLLSLQIEKRYRNDDVERCVEQVKQDILLRKCEE